MQRKTKKKTTLGEERENDCRLRRPPKVFSHQPISAFGGVLCFSFLSGGNHGFRLLSVRNFRREGGKGEKVGIPVSEVGGGEKKR